MNAPDTLKCRYCEWETKKWYTGKGGKLYGVDMAHNRLEEHCIITHPIEWERVRKLLAEDEEY
jgi:hypothetical protein